MSDDQDGCEWVNVSSGTYLGSPGQKTVKQCVCVCARTCVRACVYRKLKVLVLCAFIFCMCALQAYDTYDTQQSSYLSAIAAGSSGYGTVVPGYGQYSGESTSTTKYPSQSAYYQAASAETPSYYTR